MVPLLPPLGDPNHKELISFIEINKTGDSGYPRHYDGAKSRAGASGSRYITCYFWLFFSSVAVLIASTNWTRLTRGLYVSSRRCQIVIARA